MQRLRQSPRKPADDGDFAANETPFDDDEDEVDTRSHINEHTRLLPNRLDSDVVYLRPDDPAVSLYNLWAVRVVRHVTGLLAALTLVWWTLMLVSAFVTLPGLHARGSAWCAFGYTSVALATLVVALLFFSAPSGAARALGGVMAVLLVADVVLILAADATRSEEVWVGAASAIWALLVAVWALAADHTAQWGKCEEQERLTGRRDMRRGAGEWMQVLLSTLALLTLTLSLVLMTCSLVLRALDAKEVPPGDMISVDGGQYRIHVYCRGNQTDAAGTKIPTVLFEGGEDPVEQGLWQFADDMLKNGSIGRYCFTDRPGIAWVSRPSNRLSVELLLTEHTAE
jgi:hypothetical protein